MSNAFWMYARRMGRFRGLLALAFVFAAISAGGLGAGLVALSPVLDAVLQPGALTSTVWAPAGTAPRNGVTPTT